MIIWQIILLILLIVGISGAYAKHTEGALDESSKIATGTAGLVGVLLIITGFAASDKSDSSASSTTTGIARAPTTIIEPTTTVSVAPQASIAPTVNAPTIGQPPSSQTQYQAVQAVPQTPAQMNLGADGVAYDRIEAIIMRYKQLYDQGVNDIQKTDLRFSRGQELCRNQASRYAVVARLGDVTTNKNGDAHITFNTTSGMDLIPSDSYARGNPIHDMLGTVSRGSPVVLTFTFKGDDTGKDCFHSHRWTEENNMTKPQWDVNLISVAPQ